MDTIRLVLVSEPDFEVATATMADSGKVSYTGVDDALRSVVNDALEGKQNKRAAFRNLMRKGWSNAYLMIELKG